MRIKITSILFIIAEAAIYCTGNYFELYKIITIIIMGVYAIGYISMILNYEFTSVEVDVGKSHKKTVVIPDPRMPEVPKNLYSEDHLNKLYEPGKPL